MSNERDSYSKSIIDIGEYRNSCVIVHGGFTYLASSDGEKRQEAGNRRTNSNLESIKRIGDSYQAIKRKVMTILRSFVNMVEDVMTCNRREHLKAINQLHKTASSFNETIQMFNDEMIDRKDSGNKKMRSGDK